MSSPWIRRIVNACLMGLSLATLGLGGTSCFAEEDAIESVGDSLGDFSNYPWYDSQQDAVKRVRVKAPADLENRHSPWQTKPLNWNFPSWLGSVFKYLAWALLLLVLGFLIYWLVQAFALYEPSAGDASLRVSTSAAGDADRVEHLPFQLDQPVTSLLEAARKQYEAGNFGPAVVYLYSYLLVELDKHGQIRLTKGKTNRQYLRELRRSPGMRNMLQRTMIAFEDVFFGNHDLDRTRFESCWHNLDEFHRQLEQPTATA